MENNITLQDGTTYKLRNVYMYIKGFEDELVGKKGGNNVRHTKHTTNEANANMLEEVQKMKNYTRYRNAENQKVRNSVPERVKQAFKDKQNSIQKRVNQKVNDNRLIQVLESNDFIINFMAILYMLITEGFIVINKARNVIRRNPTVEMLGDMVLESLRLARLGDEN